MVKETVSAIKIIYHSTKAGISISVALTTATGYLLSTRLIDWSVLPPFAGVLLLAMAASLLNQIQERETDKLMPRTSKRPVANGLISLLPAYVTTFVLAIAGFLILLLMIGTLAAALGIINLFWYNLIYTPLKYKTAFASIPGGVVGAIPPLIGWVAGGGHILHPAAIALALFFFIGQIPHFWLILFKYAHEYQLAGIKLVTEHFSREQLKRVVFSWVVATALSGSSLTLLLIINHNPVFYLIHIYSLLIILYFIFWLSKTTGRESYKAFIMINVYYLLIMLTLIADLVVS